MRRCTRAAWRPAHRRRDQRGTRRDYGARPAAGRGATGSGGGPQPGPRYGQQRNRKVKFRLRLPAFNSSGITLSRDITEQSGMTGGLGDGRGVRASRSCRLQSGQGTAPHRYGNPRGHAGQLSHPCGHPWQGNYRGVSDMQRVRIKGGATAGVALVTAALSLAACSSSGSSSPSSSTKPSSSSSSAAAKLSGTLNGSGSTFQPTFQQTAIQSFKSIQPGLTVNYGGGGSGTGRRNLARGSSTTRARTRRSPPLRRRPSRARRCFTSPS